MVKYMSLLGLVCLLFSCKDEPILVEAGLHNDGKKNTLFSIETIYTVTSKKSSGGVTTRSGYTTCYLNAVDVNNGEVIKHLKIGDFKERIEFIGSAGGKAWFFSYDTDLGLHTRDATSLDVITNVKDIIAKNPALSAGITEQAYQTDMDSSGKFIFTTTKDGYNYLIDPVTLLATKTSDRSSKRYYSNDVTASGNTALNDTLEFTFTGNPRSVLEITTKTFDRHSYDFFSHGGKNVPSKMLYYKRDGKQIFEDISFIDPKKLVNTAAPCSDQNRDPLLVDGNTVFILSKSMLGNDYNWIIAAVDINYTGAKLLWKTTIDGTEKVQGSDKELLQASLVDGKLLLVFENLMAAFNKQNGNVIWRKDIRTDND